MDKFLTYCNNNNLKLYEIEANIKRLQRVTKTTDLSDLVDSITCFTPVIEVLIDKYSLSTALNILETMKVLFKYYKCDSYFLYKFTDEYNNLVDLQENKILYSKQNIFELKQKMVENTDFLTKEICFTHYRNYMLLCLFLFEFPMRLSNWSKIKLIFNDYSLLDEYDDYPFYCVVQKNQFYFIFNKFTNDDDVGFCGQYIHKIENKLICRVLSKYVNSVMISKGYLITNKSGKPITPTNLSNAITNFSRDFFGRTLTLHSIRVQWNKYKTKLIIDEKQRLILEKIYKL